MRGASIKGLSDAVFYPISFNKLGIWIGISLPAKIKLEDRFSRIDHSETPLTKFFGSVAMQGKTLII